MRARNEGAGPPTEADTFNIADDLEVNARPFLDLVDALRKYGVGKEIHIPQIAVMGDQSSGKSSVLEAISGIQFPRGTGLVTRCPTQITMRRGTVRCMEVHADGEVRSVKIGEEREIERHITELTDKLRGDKEFCSVDKHIEIKLTDSDTPDLTIIDLPGIVRTETAGQTKVVKDEVDKILQKYLEQPGTIILAVIPCNVDIATVDILERASKVDPNGKRTVGVLTKPDLVDDGGEVEIVEVLLNRKKPLLHGYYMLKNPSQKQLMEGQLTQVEYRKNELEWLNNSEYAQHAERLGVKRLGTALTGMLVSRIHECLPDMFRDVKKKLTEVQKHLTALGEGPPKGASNCRTEAIAATRHIMRVLRRDTESVHYEAKDHCVVQRENQARKMFQQEVQDTRPGFHGEQDKFEIQVTSIYNMDSKYIKGDFLQGQTRVPPRSVTTVGEEIQLPEEKESKGKIVRVQAYFRGDVAERIEEGRGLELPGFMNFHVFKNFMISYVALWKPPTEKFQRTLHEALTDAAEHAIDSHVRSPPLAKKLKSVLFTYMETCGGDAQECLQRLLEQEKMPCTENHYLWDTINKQRNERMEQKVNSISRDGPQGPYVLTSSVIAMMKSDIGNDSNESQAVQDMIDMLAAYWKLAAKRYIDSAAMTLHNIYTANKCMDALENALDSDIMHADDASLQCLFSEDPELNHRRTTLDDDKTRFTRAKELISKFMNEHTSL